MAAAPGAAGASGGAELFSYLYAAPLVHNTGYEVKPVDALDVTSERRMLLQVLAETSKIVSFRADVASTANFMREISTARVLHFTGHGMPNNVTFETKKGQLQKVPAEDLARLVASSGGRTRLVFVSACHSESVAGVFVRAGIPHVVAVAKRDEVLDAASAEFAKGFYRFLLEGRSVAGAFAAAQAQVQMCPDFPQAAAEGAKFKLLGDGDHAEAPFAQLAAGGYHDLSPVEGVNHCDAVAECFVGRAALVQQVFAQLVDGARLVSLIGMRGIGKTQIALRACAYAAQRRVFRAIFFLPLQTQTARDSQLHQLFATAFGLPVVPATPAALFEAVRARCQAPEEFLLVLDGAEDWLTAEGGRGGGDGSPTAAGSSGVDTPVSGEGGEDSPGAAGAAGGGPPLARDFLETLAHLLDRVPNLSLLVTAVHQVMRMANVAERVVPVGPLEPQEAAMLFSMRAPRKLTWTEILGGRQYRANREPPYVATVELAKTPVLRALDGHPSAICSVAAYLQDKDLVRDEAFLLSLVPGILGHAQASLGLSLFRVGVRAPAERPRLGHSVSEQPPPHHHDLQPGGSHSMVASMGPGGRARGESEPPLPPPGSRVDPALLTPDVRTKLADDGLRLWERVVGLDASGGAVAFADLAVEIAAHFAHVLPQEAQTRPLDAGMLEFLRASSAVWGGSAPAPPGPAGRVSIAMFAHFWPWFQALLLALSVTGLWGHTQPTLIHGFLTKAETKALLTGTPPGTFLIRFSESRAGNLVVAYVRENGKLNSVLLRAGADGFSTLVGGEEHVTASLQAFVLQCSVLLRLHPGHAKQEVFS